MARKVLFFGDFGVDDVFALLYAHFEEEIEVIGVVTGYGNVPREKAKQNALFIRSITGSENKTPVIQGAYHPYTGMFPDYYPEIHGEFGLGPWKPSSEAIEDFTIENYDKAMELILQNKHEITIVNVGRLTSLATLFVIYPDVSDMVREFYIMGGAFLAPGNVTAVAEANFHGDPFAANLVLTLSQNTKIVPLNVTSEAILTRQMIEYMVEHSKNKDVASILLPMFEFYYSFYKKSSTVPLRGVPFHDVLPLWAMINEDKTNFYKAPVKVVTERGAAFGQSIGDFRTLKEKEDYPVHNVALQFDYPTYTQDVMKAFTSP